MIHRAAISAMIVAAMNAASGSSSPMSCFGGEEVFEGLRLVVAVFAGAEPLAELL